MPELALLGSSQKINRNCALNIIGMTQYVYYAWCGGPIRGGDYWEDEGYIPQYSWWGVEYVPSSKVLADKTA